MKKSIVKINPFFEARMWGGGRRLIDDFHYHTLIAPIGEVYNVVALKGHADCVIDGMDITLSKLYEDNKDWFQCDTKELPIRVNILDPEADLSIQIHPDDAFAKQYNGGRGKPEAWVVLDAPKDGYIAFAHNAKSKEEFVEMTSNNKFDQLVKYIDVVVDDYLDIPCGTIHAIGKGVLTYNISRNADCTLRLYDYERIDPATNQLRDLQIHEVIDNVNIPDTSIGFVHYDSVQKEGYKITEYWDEPGLYTLKRIEIKEKCSYEYPRFAFYTVVNGEGKVNQIPIRKGDTFLVPDSFSKLDFEGELDMFQASYKNKGEK